MLSQLYSWQALVYSLTPATTTIYADSPLYSALQHLIGVFVRASDKLDEFNELRSRIVNQHEPSEALSQWLSDLDQSGTICRDITDAAAKVAASVIVNGPLTRPHFPVEYVIFTVLQLISAFAKRVLPQGSQASRAPCFGRQRHWAWRGIGRRRETRLDCDICPRSWKMVP